MAFHNQYSPDNILFDRLQQILINVRPPPQYHTRGNDSVFGYYDLYTDCDEVYTNIYIGNENVARDRSFLKSIGITHVVNVAHGDTIGFVNTGSYYYRGTNIDYLGINVYDLPTEKIGNYFQQAANFIDEGVRKGRVFVHCLMGISRAPTIVCAYLMIKKNMNVEQALTTIRRARDVRPNDGFLYSLIALDKQLKIQRCRRFINLQ